jgi:hypothetical protein
MMAIVALTRARPETGTQGRVYEPENSVRRDPG